MQADLAHQLALAGPADGAYVYDLTAKQPLFSERATTMRPPASVEKLYTATTALARMGASAHLSTTVFGDRQARAGRSVGRQPLPARRRRPDVRLQRVHPLPLRRHGRVGLHAREQLVHTDGIHRITGSVYGDESWFDSLRGEPSSDYAPDPFLEGTLSGLAFNRGESGSEGGPHAPAAYAAHELLAEPARATA